MTLLLKPTLEDEIIEVERELRMRSAVYPGQIAKGRLSREKADWQIAVMESVLKRLKMAQVG